jgi:hypothetical protein
VFCGTKEGKEEMSKSLRDRAGGLKPRAVFHRLGLSALIPFAVTACDPQAEPGVRDPRLVISTDHETGCRYISGDAIGGLAITPRLRADGKPDCPDVPIDYSKPGMGPAIQ